MRKVGSTLQQHLRLKLVTPCSNPIYNPSNYISFFKFYFYPSTYYYLLLVLVYSIGFIIKCRYYRASNYLLFTSPNRNILNIKKLYTIKAAINHLLYFHLKSYIHIKLFWIPQYLMIIPYSIEWQITFRLPALKDCHQY